MTHHDDRKPTPGKTPSDEHALGELLSAYLDDELSPDQRSELEARLETDQAARAQLDALSFSSQALSGLSRESAPAAIIDDLTLRSERMELLGEPEESITLARHKRGPFKSTMALAAMLMVAVSASLYVAMKGQEKSSLQRQLVSSDRAGEPLASARSQADAPANVSEQDSLRSFGYAMGDDLKQRERALFQKSKRDNGTAFARKGQEFAEAATDLESRSTFYQDELDEADSVAGAPAETVSASNETILALGKQEPSPRTESGAVSLRAKKVAAGAKFLSDQDDGASLSEEIAKPARDADGRDDPENAVGRSISTSRLARIEPGMTFEQKLVAGAGMTALGSHRFPDEPLQLTLVFDNALTQDAGETKLRTFFKANGLSPVNLDLDQEKVAAKNEKSASPESSTALNEESIAPAIETEMYYEGHAAQNALAPANSRQFLARLSGPTLDRMVNDLTTIGSADVQLIVGNLRSDGTAQVQHLARQALGAEVADASPMDARSNRHGRRRLASQSSTEDEGDDQLASPQSAQWLRALQAYGLFAQKEGATNKDANSPSSEIPAQERAAGKGKVYRGGQKESPKPGVAGQASRAQSVSTNGVETMVVGAKTSEPVISQKLLTVVIELVNRSPAIKHEKPVPSAPPK
ncbi:MAG: hypothetical protein GXP29_10335 [Planctomycetes bacterium]|nr:hypothetical protein [Planctomycetota bacterium]